jgi:hypothetical protein
VGEVIGTISTRTDPGRGRPAGRSPGGRRAGDVAGLFAVRRGRAAAWFLLLPLAVCLLSGVGGAAYGVLTSSPD